MDKVTRQCPQTTTFLMRKESRSGIEPRSFRLPAYRLAARPNQLTKSVSINHSFWREKWAGANWSGLEPRSFRLPAQRALPLGQAGSPRQWMAIMSCSFFVRSLRHYLRPQSRGCHTIDRVEDRGVKSESARQSSLKGRVIKMMVSWCLMSSDVSWHIRDKWPMPKHGSIILYVHGNQKAR